MRILVVHERYRQRGGEDAAVDNEIAQLRAAGLEIQTLIKDNRDLTGTGNAAMAARAVWSLASRRELAAVIAQVRPDVMHVHNFWPMLSPSIYDAAHAARVPVVQSLHNYRLLCANALLLRDGAPCELCVDRRMKWPAIRHRCYRGSIGASAAVAAMTAVHAALGTFERKVDRFVALSPMAASLFVAGGIPADRLEIIPNAVADPGPPMTGGREGAVFVGRLSPEKGLDTLLAAWEDIDHPLTVIGDGPLGDRLRSRAARNVHFLGRQAPGEVSAALSRAALLVFPSLCRENLPLVVAEAMAHGVPVLASPGGAVDGMIAAGVSGTFAAAGDASAWRDAARALLGDRDGLARLGLGARTAYEARYHPDHVTRRRLEMYGSVLRAAA